jgi:hypothetical protein
MGVRGLVRRHGFFGRVVELFSPTTFGKPTVFVNLSVRDAGDPGAGSARLPLIGSARGETLRPGRRQAWHRLSRDEKAFEPNQAAELIVVLANGDGERGRRRFSRGHAAQASTLKSLAGTRLQLANADAQAILTAVDTLKGAAQFIPELRKARLTCRA